MNLYVFFIADPNAPSMLVFSSKTINSMTATWRAPNQDTAVDGYDVMITDLSNSGASPENFPDITALSRDFTGLMSGVLYKVDVSAFTRDHTSAKVFSDVLTGQTNTG